MSEKTNKKNVNTLDSKTLKKQEKTKKIIKLTLIYAFLTMTAIYILLPLYWMLNTSLKTYEEFWRYPLRLFPHNPTLDNFKQILNNNETPLLKYMLNTVVVGIVSTTLVLTTTILSAFSFARLKFKGSSLLFTLILSTMMIPTEMYIITNFVTISNLGWYDTHTALIVPSMVSVFYIFLLTQSFKQIPDELYLAAKVDGKSDWQYLWRVMVPIAKPTIITITILKILTTWNSYIWPNLVSNSDNTTLISVGLKKIAQNINDGDLIPHHELEMAGALLVSIPILILFTVLRKHIMQGVGRSGTKG